MKINAIVFDLDETIGYFTQLYNIWETLQIICENKGTQELFNLLLDVFNDYMRPLIFNIFNYLKQKKINNKHIAVMIYTNNNSHKSWTLLIKEYIQHKLNFNLFDNVICAFKVNGKVIEPCRTTYKKTYSDLIRCTSLPKTSQIFFIDDQYHEKMNHENIYYIKIKPYIFQYSYEEVINKINDKNITDYINKNYYINKKDFNDMFINKYTHFKFEIAIPGMMKNNIENHIDINVGKQIMKHMSEFFYDIIENKQTRKNKKNKYNISKKTMKKYF